MVGKLNKKELFWIMGLIFLILIIVIISYAQISKNKISISENVSQEIIDFCKEEKKVVCHGNCEDGFGEKCYFNGQLFNKENLETGFWLPAETKKICFGINSYSTCNKCYNKFELNSIAIYDVFSEVSCEQFFHEIEKINESCGGCVEIISTGCC